MNPNLVIFISETSVMTPNVLLLLLFYISGIGSNNLTVTKVLTKFWPLEDFCADRLLNSISRRLPGNWEKFCKHPGFIHIEEACPTRLTFN